MKGFKVRNLLLMGLIIAYLGVAGLAQPHVETNPTVQFQWDAVTDWNGVAAGYQLHIGTATGGPYVPIGVQVGVPVTTHFLSVGECSNDASVCAVNGAVRYYVVTARNTVPLESGYSNEIAAEFRVGPATPQNFTVTSGP
jgi:hypothetical protein